jgi:hypothetical protein
MTTVSTEHLRSFAECGYVVVPEIVAPRLVASAMAEIDRVIDQDPPPAEKRGFHCYWVDDIAAPNPLPALLTESGAADIISAFIEPPSGLFHHRRRRCRLTFHRFGIGPEVRIWTGSALRNQAAGLAPSRCLRGSF